MQVCPGGNPPQFFQLCFIFKVNVEGHLFYVCQTLRHRMVSYEYHIKNFS